MARQLPARINGSGVSAASAGEGWRLSSGKASRNQAAAPQRIKALAAYA